MDRNCLSYWLPRLVKAGVPTPKTTIIDAGENWFKMIGIADGPRHKESWDAADAVIAPLVEKLVAAAPTVGGYPLFLRTGHFSGKHDWKNACFVPAAEVMAGHVRHLVYMSEMFAMMGELPYQVWCLRELLPTEPVAVLPRYDDFPLNKEVRTFTRGGKIVCTHSYWPVGAIRDGLNCSHWPVGAIRDGLNCSHRPADANPLAWSPKTCPTCLELASALAAAVDPLNPDDEWHWRPLAQRVAEAFAGDGAWSVDILLTRNGWVVTDMAEAGRSFHWPGCPNTKWD